MKKSILLSIMLFAISFFAFAQTPQVITRPLMLKTVANATASDTMVLVQGVDKIVRKMPLSSIGAIEQKPYKVYTALLSQSGTNDPSSNVLIDEISMIGTWEYLSVGYYSILLPNDVDINKVFVYISPTINGYSAGTINYNVVNNFGQKRVNISTTIPSNPYGFNDIMDKTPIEIRVYN